MNVASCYWRFLYIVSLFLLTSETAFTMILDNRYFPWIPHYYTGSTHSHGNITIDPFFITGGDAYRHEPRSEESEKIVSYPELWGELKLDEVANSMVQAGLNNPIPVDWRWLTDFNAKVNASLESQGLAVQGYVPVSKHFGIGGSALLMRLTSFVTVAPEKKIIDKLYLDSPGNQALFSQTLAHIYDELDITSTSLREIVTGDVVVYATIYDEFEYYLKFRKIDYGLSIGFIIPSGLKQDPSNLASIPVGGNGLWGLYFEPYAEFELKDDLKFGIVGRLSKRLDRQIASRVPIGKEHYLFAPIAGNVLLDAGTTFTGSAYIAYEDLGAGLGIQGKYTVTYHARDKYCASLTDPALKPKFSCVNNKSEFISEYATIRLFYDTGYDKASKNRPVISLTWDVPRNHLGGKGFAKTHRISLGCTVNF